ncbi:MAG: cytochrome-c peroxidase [Verrucomicrobiales bacterium]
MKRKTPYIIAKSLIFTLMLGQATAMAADDNLDLFQPSLKRLDNLPRSAEDTARVDLGRHLYYEKRLSMNNQMSCNTCHDLKDYGVDGEAFSMGVDGGRVGRNSPTVYNAFMHLTQFWDGRSPTVEEQAKGPILASKEMGMPSPEFVIGRLKKMPEYADLFKTAFPRSADPVNYQSVGDAIGAFERLLVTPSRFDAYLDGKKNALTAEEVKGFRKFVEVGCATCHNGTLLGGQSYQKAGLVKPWPNQKDLGRFDVTNQEADKFMFKVPSLRNIEKTAPFFHDSTRTTLDEAVRVMGRHQLGVEIPEEDVKSIVTFLKSLTGEIPLEFVAERKLPEAGAAKKPADAAADFE